MLQTVSLLIGSSWQVLGIRREKERKDINSFAEYFAITIYA